MVQNSYSFEGKSFVGKTLVLDGKSFSNCKFNNCTFVYSGGNPPILNGCTFDDCRWQFGGAAARTLGFFSGLYSGGFDQMVEATFHGIRKGEAFANIPVEDDPLDGNDNKDNMTKSSSIFGFKPPRILKISKKK